MKYFTVDFKIRSSREGKALSGAALETAWELVCALAAEAGFDTFSDVSEGTTGYVQQETFDSTRLQQLLRNLPLTDVSVSFTVTPSPDLDWNETWEREGFDPIFIDSQCVIHDTRHQPENLPPHIIDITIDPRQAFGTGTHETTRLMAQQILTIPIEGKRVLDCGCGTGILSILALKKGGREVVAYDIDPWSVENTLHNASLNDIDNIEVLQGDHHVLSHVSGLFDCVMANINRNILLSDLEYYSNVMGPGAFLLISGFYVEDAMQIAEAAGHLRLRLTSTTSDNNWCCLLFQKEE